MERIGAKIISVVVQIVLARILAPEVYGTVTLVLVITNFLQVFVEFGFGTALIQKKEADGLDFSSVFYFNICFCLMLYALLFAFSPVIARIYKNLSLIPVIRAVGLILIIAGVRNVLQAYIARNMLFKKFFFATLSGTLLGGAAGIIMALKGFGVWAYVAQYLILNTLSTAVLWFTVPWRPEKAFSAERLKTLFSYGWKLLASSILNSLSDYLRPLLIGVRFSASDLAFYNYGVTFPNLIVENVNSSIDSVLLPTLSSQQDSREKVLSVTRRAVQVSTYIMWPLMLGLFACAGPLVSFALGEKWLFCVPYIRIFCVYYGLFPIHTANLNAIKAIGRSDVFLKLEIVKKVLDFSVVAVTIFMSVKAMALGLLAEGIISLLINSWPNSKLIDYSFSKQIKDTLPAFLLAAAMSAVVFALTFLGLDALPTLILQVIFGAVFYAGVSRLLKNETFYYLLSVLRNLLHKGGEQQQDAY